MTSLTYTSILTSHPLRNVFEAMTEKGEDSRLIGSYIRSWERPGDLPRVIEIVCPFASGAQRNERKDTNISITSGRSPRFSQQRMQVPISSVNQQLSLSQTPRDPRHWSVTNYPLANEIAKGYSNATVRPSVRPSHPCEHSRINILQWILTKLGTYLVLKRIWNPIDFQGHRSRSPGQIFTA
jgi:hypothetical protein